MEQTPIQQIGQIESNELYIKREDLIPISFGGNKARKALLFFKEIDAGGYDSVVTYGSSSSNHGRVVANLCASRGLRCIIVSPQEASEPTNNSRMMRLFGAELVTVPVSEVHDTIEAQLVQLHAGGFKPFFIPGGGHGNTGTQAYVDCYQEICAWEKAQGMSFDMLFLASGTGTTQAGLVCGQLLAGDDRLIYGISIARKNPYGRNVVLDSIRDYVGDRFTDGIIENHTLFLDDFTGEGYAKVSAEILGTIREMLCRYGIPLDTTYTGKAFYGMMQVLRRQKITGKRILFLHTGGTPLFFDDLSHNSTFSEG